MNEYPHMCRDEHVEIGFREEAPDGDERCPICYLRDWLTTIADETYSDRPGIAAERRNMAVTTLLSYPFIPNAPTEGKSNT